MCLTPVERDAQVSWQGVCMRAGAACWASQTVLFSYFCQYGGPRVHTRAHTAVIAVSVVPWHLYIFLPGMWNENMYTRDKNKLNVMKNGGKQMFLSPYSMMTFSQCCTKFHRAEHCLYQCHCLCHPVNAPIYSMEACWESSKKRKHATVSLIESKWQCDIYIEHVPKSLIQASKNKHSN